MFKKNYTIKFVHIHVETYNERKFWHTYKHVIMSIQNFKLNLEL